MKKLGILALQGDVPEHRTAAEQLLGAEAVQMVRRPEELEAVDALIVPGGESTTIGRLLESTGLRDPLLRRGREGLPILATCAGLILVARHLEPSPGGRDPTPLGLLDVTVRRNDYGRQAESFEADVKVEGLPGSMFPGVFIRAPRILAVGASVTAVAHRGEEVVGVRAGPLWGLCFHPELSGDLRCLKLFLGTSGLLPTSPARPAAGRAHPRKSTK
jgi:5'-phosphate synthase pdxT subunit